MNCQIHHPAVDCGTSKVVVKLDIFEQLRLPAQGDIGSDNTHLLLHCSPQGQSLGSQWMYDSLFRQLSPHPVLTACADIVAAGIAGAVVNWARAAGASGRDADALEGLAGSSGAGACSCIACVVARGTDMAASSALSGCGIDPAADGASELAICGGGRPQGIACGGTVGGALSGRGCLLHARSAASAMTLWRLVGLRGGPAELGRCCRGERGRTDRQLHTGMSSLGMRLGRDLDTQRLQRSCKATHY